MMVPAPPPQGSAAEDPPTGGMSAHDLGPALEPALLDACEGRLEEVHWFRRPWQRGGAATATAEYRCEDGVVRPVVVKFPVRPAERRVLEALQERCAFVPKVVAGGEELGPYHFAWVVMELLPGDPPRTDASKVLVESACSAAAGFHQSAAEMWEVDTLRANRWDWPSLIERAREASRSGGFAGAAEWASELKAQARVLTAAASEWAAREINAWVHGDLHLGNLMMREEGSVWGPSGAILLDYAEVRCGHWVEDAVYLERTLWVTPEVVKQAKCVSAMARARRKLGLATDGDYARLADTRRLLSAAIAPMQNEERESEVYMTAALDRLRAAATRLHA